MKIVLVRLLICMMGPVLECASVQAAPVPQPASCNDKQLPTSSASTTRPPCSVVPIAGSASHDIAHERALRNEAIQAEFAREKTNGRFQDRVLSPNERGIQEFQEVSGIAGSFNAWVGYVGSTLYVVASGYEFNDPRQGEVVLLQGNVSTREFFPTPKIVGPVYVTSEKDGLVQVTSKGGTYTLTDGATGRKEAIHFDGGVVFTFDIRTHRFK
jgi:hypothetical protein